MGNEKWGNEKLEFLELGEKIGKLLNEKINCKLEFLELREKIVKL